MIKRLQPTIFYLLAFFLSIATAQNNASVNLFMPTAYESSIKFAASVIGVCQGRTTYGVRCVSGILASGFTCGPKYPEATITEDASTYIATKTTPFSSAVVTLTETCTLGGLTTASCTATISISGSKGGSTTSTSSTITGTDIPEFYRFQMPVTAGAQLLSAPSNACSGADHRATVQLVGLLMVVCASVLVVMV